MTRVGRWLVARWSMLRHLGERGSTRHVLLIVAIAAVLFMLFSWQGKVSCLYNNLATTLPDPHGGPPSFNC